MEGEGSTSAQYSISVSITCEQTFLNTITNRKVHTLSVTYLFEYMQNALSWALIYMRKLLYFN